MEKEGERGSKIEIPQPLAWEAGVPPTNLGGIPPPPGWRVSSASGLVGLLHLRQWIQIPFPRSPILGDNKDKVQWEIFQYRLG